MAIESPDHNENHDLHHVPESWWQPAVGLSTLFAGLGAFFIGKSLIIGLEDGSVFGINNFILGFFFLVLFFGIFGGALYNETSRKRFSRRDQEAQLRKKELLQNPKGFAKYSFMWIFLATETLFFTLIIGASLVLRVKTGGYGPESTWIPGHELSVPLTAINTFILIISSYTMVKALQTIETSGDHKKAGKYLFVTFGLGLLFVLIQGFEYIALWNEGFRPEAITLAEDINPYFPATFYLQTGFHGLHVFFGVFIMFFVALKAWRGGYSKENHDSIELIGYYWHFVDLIWVILFTVVYLF